MNICMGGWWPSGVSVKGHFFALPSAIFEIDFFLIDPPPKKIDAIFFGYFIFVKIWVSFKLKTSAKVG